MVYCRKCQGEHKPFRRIDATYLGTSYFANRFATRPDVFPEFIRWLRAWAPDAAGEATDEQILDWFNRGRGATTDLLHGIVDPGTLALTVPPTRFLVLRDTNLSDAAQYVTAVSDAPLCNVAIGFGTEDGVMAVVSWLLSEKDAHGLADAIRERLGDPDMDASADHEGAEHMSEAFQEHAVHFHKE